MAIANRAQVSRVAAFLKANPPKTHGMNFHSVQTPGGELVLDSMYPPIGHPQTVEFFFFACLHQYGFWYGDDKGYVEPMVGEIGGKKIKGSDLLWTLLKRKLDANPEFFTPARLAQVSMRELADVLADDIATPWPDFEERFKLTRAYGKFFLRKEVSPSKFVEVANGLVSSLKGFLCLLGGVPGFHTDKLQKKQLLLAMILANRPEKFLNVTDLKHWQPIVDYHLMRVALRLGLVDLYKADGPANTNRQWVSPVQEAIIREAVYVAVRDLIEVSGLSMAAIDETLWMARKYCPEMEAPNCEKCLFTSACDRRTERFQPVFRTTAY